MTLGLLRAVRSESRDLREEARALEAESTAQDEAETAKQVSEFLIELFQVSTPGEAGSDEITAREILDRGAERIVQDQDIPPVVRARLMGTLGMVYRGLGLFDQAFPLLEEALRPVEPEGI